MLLKSGNPLLNGGIFLREGVNIPLKCPFLPRIAFTVLAPRSASALCHLPILESNPKTQGLPWIFSSLWFCIAARIWVLLFVLCRNTSWRSSARQTRRPWIPRSWHRSRRCLSSGGTCAPRSLSQMEFILTNWCSETSGNTTLNSLGKRKTKQGFVVCSLQSVTAGVARRLQCLLLWGGTVGSDQNLECAVWGGVLAVVVLWWLLDFLNYLTLT